MKAAIYGRLAQALAMMPATRREIAAALDVSADQVGVWLQDLRAAGIVRRGVWIAGEGVVWHFEAGSPFPRAVSRPISTVVRFVAAWRLLSSRQTSTSMAAALSVSQRTASDIIGSLREHGLVRIAGWEIRGCGTYTPAWDRLCAADAPRPAADSRTVTNARYWARRRDGLTQARAA